MPFDPEQFRPQTGFDPEAFRPTPTTSPQLPSSFDKFIALLDKPQEKGFIDKAIEYKMKDLKRFIQRTPHKASIFKDPSEYDVGERAFEKASALEQFLGQLGYTTARYLTTPLIFPYDILKGLEEAEEKGTKAEYVKENITGLIKMITNAPKQVQIMASRAIGLPPSKETIQQLGYEEAERALAEAPESPGFGLLMARGIAPKLKGHKVTVGDVSRKAVAKDIKTVFKPDAFRPSKTVSEIATKKDIPKKEVIKKPVVETPKEVISEIIEGKKESRIGTKEFKKQMLAELDKLPLDEYKVLKGEHTVKIPRDGEFILKDGADIADIKKRVRALKEGIISKTDYSKPLKGKTGTYQAETGAPAPTLEEGLESGIVEFKPSTKSGKPLFDPQNTKQQPLNISTPKGHKIVVGKSVKIHSRLNTFIHKYGKGYSITEAESGLRIALKKSSSEAITEAKKAIKEFGIKNLQTKIKEHIKKSGIANEIKVTGKKSLQLKEGKAVGVGAIAFEIPKSLEPSKGKAIGPSDIHRYFKKSLNLPIRIGHFAPSQSRFWSGFYRTKAEVVRMKDFKDIGTITHEIAHHIDKKYNIKQLRLRNRELAKLDYSYPKKSRTSEGFAEFIRIWMTGADDVARLAPKFTKNFENFLNKNPELKTILNNGKELITRWREQGAVKRVYSQIEMSGKSTKIPFVEKITGGFRKFREIFVDDLAQLDYAERKIRGVKNLEKEARQGGLRPSESPTLIARADAKKSHSKAKSMILDGTFDYSGKKTGISLREALAPISKDIENWLTYAYAKRAVDLYKRDINPGIELGDAKFVVSKLETPVFKKALKDVTDFQDRTLEYLKEAGGLSDDAVKIIHQMNPIYIPLKRVFEADKGAFLQGKKLADVSIPIKRIKGSGRQVKNPLHSIIENTAQIIQTADKIRVGKSLVELAEKREGAGKWVEKVPTPKQFHKTTLKTIEKQLRESGVDLTEADLGQVITFFSNAPKYLGKDNIVSFWRKGKREFYEIDPALYRSLSAMDAIQLKGYMKILGIQARGVRLGATGLRPGFSLITNPIRDAFGFAMQTEFSRGTPELIGKGLYRKLRTGDPMHQLFKQSGTDFSQYLGIDRRQLKNAVDEVLANNKKRMALNVVKHPIEGLKAAFSVTEAAPRLAEFEAAYKKGGELYGKESADARILASIAASDVTVNFGRMGSAVSSLNQLIPFFNAGIQGISRFNRYMMAHPVKGSLKGIAVITTPTIVLWNMNKDEQWYKEMPNWLKYGFWNIHLGTNKDGSPLILRIPRPFEWGIAFGSAPEAALNYFYDKDKEALKEASKQMIEYVNPIDLPTSLKIPIEVWANYDFFRDRNIDPFFEIKYKEPEDRFSPYTTETAKVIGKTFGLSPRMIDHIIGSSTGGLGIDVTKAVEGVGKPSTIKTPADYPVVGRLFVRTETPEKRKKNLKYLRQEEKGKIKRLLKANKKKEAFRLIKNWNNKYPELKFYFKDLK